MKRMITLLLALSLLLSLAACGKEDPVPTAAPTAPPAANPPETQAPGETEEPTSAPTQAVLTENLVLMDNENLTFTITKFDDNAHLGLQMQVYCENKSDRPMIFSLDGVSVCGIMYDPFWAQEVDAGKAAYSTVSFDTFELEQYGVLSPDEISFRLSVIDSEEWMNAPFADEHFTVYPTGLDADTVVYPEYQHQNGETIIEDEILRYILV